MDCNIFFSDKNIEIPDISIGDLVVNNAYKNNPEKIFHIDSQTLNEYNGKQMVELCQKFAVCLSKLGYIKKDVIAIVLPSVFEYHYIFHGIHLNGCIPTTISPDSTIEDIKNTISQVSPKLLITFSAVANGNLKVIQDIIPSLRNIIVIDEDTEGISLNLSKLMETSNIKEFNQVQVDSNDIGMIPFSSGTTGLNKGVVLSHHNIVSNILQIQHIESSFYNSCIDPTIVGCTPYFHSYGMIFFLCLYPVMGCKNIILPKYNQERFFQLIENFKVTTALIVPPVALAFAKNEILNRFNLESLKMLFVGAAPLGDELVTMIKKNFNGNIIVKQGYGLSEASPVLTIIPPEYLKSGTVGKLLPNICAKIIDPETGEQLGVNQIGELLCKGPNIMMGYFNNEEATSNTMDSQGFLKTGDIGYFDEEQFFYIIDRLKEMIKYNGYQIAPAEIEGILLKHEKIVDAAVIGIPDEKSGEVPRAYIVKREGCELSEEEIHQHVNEVVTFYKKIRGGIEFVKSIPKSSSGKILRKNLRMKYKESIN